MTMRVTHVINDSGFSWKSRHLLTQLHAMQARGVEVELITLATQPEAASRTVALARQTGIPVYEELLSRPMDIRLVNRLVGRFRKTQPHVVHTHIFDADYYGTFAARRAGVPAVISTRYNDLASDQRRWTRMLNRRLWKQLDRILAVSQHARDYNINALAAPANKVAVIPYGIDPDAYRVGLGARAVIGAEIGVSEDALLVGMFCSESDGPGIKDGLETLWHVSVRRSDVHLVVVGNGPEVNRLIQQAQGYQMSSRVHFLGWRDDIPAILKTLDVLLIPGVTEDPGILLLESMALNTPVITTNAPGVDEIIIDGENGLLVPAGDVDHMTSSLSLLLDDPGLRQSLAAAARQHVQAHFGFERMVSDTLTVYEQV